MRKAAIVVFAALAGAPLPALAQLAQSEPTNAGTGLLAPDALTTELPNGFQQNSSSKLQALIPGDLSKFVDRKPEQAAAESFYQARNYQPIWTGSPEASKRAEDAIAFLRNVRSEGDRTVADYGWLADDGVRAGELRVTWEDELIRELVITFE